MLKFLKLFTKKFIFRNLPEHKLIVFDCVNDKYFRELFQNTDYYSLSSRLERIETIFINFELIKFIFQNFLKRKIKQNYLISLIKQMKPKLVITLTDNSKEFSIISKYFDNEVPFYAIQGANRGDIKLKTIEDLKIYNFDTFFCYSPYEKDFYTKKKIKIKNYIYTGPIRASLALKYFNKERIVIKNKHDIFLPTELSYESPYNKFTNYSDSCKKLAEFTLSFCDKNNLKLIFSAEAEKNTELFRKENKFYKNVLQRYDVKLTPKAHKYSAYQNMLESNLIVGLNTTLLREAIYLRRKVFACNLTLFDQADFPIRNIASPVIKNQSQFNNHLSKLLEMENKTYFEIIKNEIFKITQIDQDCSEIINSKVNNIILNKI